MHLMTAEQFRRHACWEQEHGGEACRNSRYGACAKNEAQLLSKSAGETKPKSTPAPPGDSQNFEDLWHSLQTASARFKSDKRVHLTPSRPELVSRISTHEAKSTALPSRIGDSGNLGDFGNLGRPQTTTSEWLDFDADGFSLISKQEMSSRETRLGELKASPLGQYLWKLSSQIEMDNLAVSSTGSWTATDEIDDSSQNSDPIHAIAVHESMASLPGPTHCAVSIRSPLPVLSVDAHPGLSTLDLPPEVPSVGTLGHPLNCKAACKFHKTRGCLHGKQCTRCHLCHWTRNGSKTEHVDVLKL
eukprot:TRINITY_DN8504_c0_g1_i1.p1 TRINITY_DN8504_c0_g1~~TRINITY_DN8504_c0_g1_i1.p1  ORF type:complete len:302 (+),score=33.88 TRINITY_DN8504_c0_g1_i1:137-1042(+)